MMDLTCESMTAGFLSNDYDQYVELESIILPHEYMHAYDRNDALKEDCSKKMYFGADMLRDSMIDCGNMNDRNKYSDTSKSDRKLEISRARDSVNSNCKGVMDGVLVPDVDSAPSNTSYLEIPIGNDLSCSYVASKATIDVPVRTEWEMLGLVKDYESNTDHYLIRCDEIGALFIMEWST